MGSRSGRGAVRLLVIPATVLMLTLGAGAAQAENNAANGSERAAEAQSDQQGPKAQPPGNGRGGSGKGPAKPESDVTEPQPPSNADFSGDGANVHGPYDSTRDGSPSQNGNGGGKATGKPCAGCVGKADNKNPPGQMPGGSDANAGYECDRNSGVGKSNPAHTSCVPGEEPPGEEPPGEEPPGEEPPGEEPPGEEPPGEEPPGEEPPGKEPPGPQPPGDQSPTGGGDAPEALPTTGVDPELPLSTGLALIAAGAALLLLARRARRNLVS